jgi:6-phosphogluconolactonase (cycloisomerase 2 family)
MRAHLLPVVLLASLLAIATGCGQTGSNSTNMASPPTAQCAPSAKPTFAYVLSYSDATISMYSADSCTGALTALKAPTVSTGVDNGFNAEEMAIDPTNRFLYVANLGSNATDAATVSMFTIDPSTGELTANNPAQVPTGYFPQGIAAAGNSVYTANSDDNSVSMFSVDRSSGLLTALSPSELVVPPICTSCSSESSPDFVSVGPSGKFLYATDQDNGSISTFAINSQTGALTPTRPPGINAGLNPWKVVFDPSGKFAYVPDEDFNKVWMYTVDANNGTLTQNKTALVAAGNQPSFMAVHPSGKFAYVVNRYDNTVSMYIIDGTGVLSPNVPATVAAGSWPFSIAVNAAGTFAYVGNQDDSSISIYSIGVNGVLTSAGTMQTASNPVDIALIN